MRKPRPSPAQDSNRSSGLLRARRPGRSRSSASREIEVTVKFSAAEARALMARAASAGLPRAVFLRLSGLRTRIVAPRVPAINLRALFTLQRIRAEIEQVRRRGTTTAEIAQRLSSIEIVLQHLYRGLLDLRVPNHDRSTDQR